jgi:hypothetical protein
VIATRGRGVWDAALHGQRHSRVDVESDPSRARRSSRSAGEKQLTLNEQTLAEIGCLHDPIGVLSVYVDARPDRTRGERPGWEVAARNQLRALQRRLSADGPRERQLAFAARRAELEAELSRLLDPRASGRGRALFFPLSDGKPWRLWLQAALPDRIVLDEIAHTRPLVVAFSRGRAAGVAAVSRAGVRVLEWRFSAWFSFFADTSDWREMKGPAAANPALAQQTAPQRDRFERRLEERRAAFARSVGERLARLSAARDWREIILFGDPRLAVWLQHQGLENDGRAILVGPQHLEALAREEVERAVAREVAPARRKEEVVLAERVRAEAFAGGAAALGIDETARAFDEARVLHLLFDHRREYAGARAPDGRLAANGAIAGVPIFRLRREPDLAERMIERAFATRALVTLLGAPAARLLDDFDGMAAFLRW